MFLLSRPSFLSFKNRFFYAPKLKTVLIRDSVVIILSLFVMIGGLVGTRWMLAQLNDFFTFAYLSPTIPLYLVFLILSGLLVISNIVSMSGSLYQSDDIELILAAPIGNSSFFIQRFFQTALSTSIASFVFILPILLGYSLYFNGGFKFWFSVIISLIPYFCIPALIGFMLSSLLACFISLRKSKLLIFIVIFALMYFVWQGIDVLRLIILAKDKSSDVTRLVSIFSFAKLDFAPSSLLVEVIEISLGRLNASIWPRLGYLWGLFFILLGISGIWIEKYFNYAFSASKALGGKQEIRGVLFMLSRVSVFDPYRSTLTITFRDIVSLLRDTTQVFQFVLLIGIFIMYLYNVRLFSGLSSVGPTEFWWQQFFLISNFCMSAFVVLALCTRFVFPSMSGDGRGFMAYIAKAPITMRKYILIKYFFWLSIVGPIHVASSALGAYASSGSILQILVQALCSLIVTVGIVGIAVGLGSIFARFDWEHLGQLAVGYGSIIFMLSSTAWIFLCLIPVWLIQGYLLTSNVDLFFIKISICSFIIISSNLILTCICLSKGIAALNYFLE